MHPMPAMGPVATHTNLSLAVVSVAAAVLAAYGAIDLLQRAAETTGWRWRLLIVAGGVTLGVGIWTMHFIGMVAFEMDMAVSYNAVLVAMSLAAAVVGSGVAFAVVARPGSTVRGLIFASVFMGLAIAAMHYLGMASMDMAATVSWNVPLVALSLAIAFGASFAALWLVTRIGGGFNLGVGTRVGASLALGFGIAGLHYTAMSAATFHQVMANSGEQLGNVGSTSLVVLLGIGAAVMLAVLLGGAAADRRRAAVAVDLAQVSQLARDLARGGDARRRTCDAVLELADADLVALLERDDKRRLTLSAATGSLAEGDLADLAADPLAVATAEGGPAVFRTEVEAGSAIAALGGRSALFETLALDGRPIGAVVVIWAGRRRAVGERLQSLLGMLGAEAAIAIDREDLLARLDHLARRDELTGLVNRRVFGEEMDAALVRAREDGKSLSLVMLDLDDFKGFNDSRGHQAGDRLLRTAAAAWQAVLRDADTIARYGGDEFIAILPDCDAEAAAKTAERLRLAVPEGVSCSAGVATWDGTQSTAQLIGAADDRLYRAKGLGRDRTIGGEGEILRTR
jgi:diguanylate cyclase (GGDEF)-like protein